MSPLNSIKNFFLGGGGTMSQNLSKFILGELPPC